MSDLDTIAALLPGRVYRLNAVPKGTAAYPYRVVSLAPNAPQVRSLDGSGDPVGRLVVQHFARDADTVSDEAAETFNILDATFLPLPGEPQALLEVASPVYRDPDDDGVLAVTQTYRY